MQPMYWRSAAIAYGRPHDSDVADQRETMGEA